MGIFDLFKNKSSPVKKETVSACLEPPEGEPGSSSSIEAETCVPCGVSLDDMNPFSGNPFVFDLPVYSVGAGYFDPWRMDLSSQNQFAADDQIAQMNDCISRAYLLSEEIPIDLVFPQNHVDYSRSKILCNPYTPTGKPSKYPFSLLVIEAGDNVTGCTMRIDYFPDGTVGKTSVSLWRGPLHYSLKYKTVGRQFVLSSVKTNKDLPLGAPLKEIYRF